MKACCSPIMIRKYNNIKDHREMVFRNLYNNFRGSFTPQKDCGYELMEVPCGKCLPCLAKKADEWSMRLLHENTLYGNGMNSMFITLTYNDENLPKNYSLCKRDMQLFIKRVRKKLGSRKIKYFACGEYGLEFGRPHYHAIVFGMSYFNKLDHHVINSCWQKGFTKIGTTNIESIIYTTKYMQKDNKLGFNEEKYFQLTAKQKPFRLMSQGLGKTFAIKNMESILKNGGCAFNGTQISIPRQYLKWYYHLTKDNSIKEKIRLYSLEKRRAEIEQYAKEMNIKPTIKHYDNENNRFYEVVHPLIERKLYEKMEIRKRHFRRQNEEYLANKINQSKRKAILEVA